MSENIEKNETTNAPELEKERKAETVKLQKMDFAELQTYAQKQDIDVYGKSRDDIMAELGFGGKRGAYVFYVKLDPDYKKALESQHKRIPRPVLIPVAEKKQWMKIIEKDPHAFNGVDLTDKTGPVVRVLDRHVKCVCGAEFDIPEYRTEMDRRQGVNKIRIKMCPGQVKRVTRFGQTEEIKVCIDENQFRKYIYHEVPDK